MATYKFTLKAEKLNNFNVNLQVAEVHFFFKAVDNKFACVLLK